MPSETGAKDYLQIPTETSKNEEKAEAKDEHGEKLPVRIYLPGEIKIKMKDIGGYDEAKLEIVEFINFINNKQRYLNLGAKLLNGALLHGPPGTGKTLLAKATAGEGNIPFLACQSASLLVSETGPKQLGEVFEVARKFSPCVLFFDEVDCLGLNRHHWRSKPATRCLTEEFLIQLDGFKKYPDKDVIVFGATNDFDVMDPALIRPGRFDRIIEITEPDLEARMSIARVHLEPLKTSLDKDNLAIKLGILTPKFTGAKIAAVCNEAAMIASRLLAEEITSEHFDHALERINFGVKKKKPLDDKAKKIAAVHDAGHAVIGWHLKDVKPPSKLSISPDLNGLFICCMEDFEVSATASKEEFFNATILYVAGLAAEEVVLGEYAATGTSDLEKLSFLMLKLFTKFGQSKKLGMVATQPYFMASYASRKFKDLDYPTGDSTTIVLFNEMQLFVTAAFEAAKKLCEHHKTKLNQLSTILLRKNILNLEDLEGVLGVNENVDVNSFSLKSANALPLSLQQWNVAK